MKSYKLENVEENKLKDGASNSGLIHGILYQLCTIFSFLQFLLSFSELSKVEGCDLLGLLNLLLVGLDLLLQLGGQLGHSLLVLLVLVLGEHQLLDLPL